MRRPPPSWCTVWWHRELCCEAVPDLTGVPRWCSCRTPTTPSTVARPRSPSGRRRARPCYYALACRGEVGIAGMPPEEAGPLREDRTTPIGRHRRRARSAVLGFPGQPDPRHTRAACQDRRHDHRAWLPMSCSPSTAVRSGRPAPRTSATTSSSPMPLRRHMTRSPTHRDGSSRTARKSPTPKWSTTTVSTARSRPSPRTTVYLSVLDPDTPVTGAGAQAGRHDDDSQHRNSAASAPCEFILRRFSPVSSRSVACCAHSPRGTGSPRPSKSRCWAKAIFSSAANAGSITAAAPVV